MKGDPHAPQCGFSETATRIFKVKGVPFPARNNLEGQGPWEAMKTSGNNNGTLFLHPMICFGVRRTSSFKDAEIVLLDEKEFHKLADELLHYLQEKFDELGEENDIEGFDIDHAEGVVTIKLGAFGTYVINKQTPNRQVWLSSPVSGPARFDWDKEQCHWIYKRTKVEILKLLEKEVHDLLGVSIVLSR
ncbi:hypothetical protein KP509_13G099100 [Ceratopteris richardii]|nr:hypothetical protein KP509_13G099100 [Ceratopteris richardii]